MAYRRASQLFGQQHRRGMNIELKTKNSNLNSQLKCLLFQLKETASLCNVPFSQMSVMVRAAILQFCVRAPQRELGAQGS